MSNIEAVESACYSIPLATPLSDSTHGVMHAFEVVTARVRDVDGVEGLGYTFTTGQAGKAVATIVQSYLSPALIGTDADLVEERWQQMWWKLHYGGRGGSVALAHSAVDIALWDLKARRLDVPLWRLLGGHDPLVPVYAGGIDLQLSLDDLLRQTDRNLEAGFRAIKMKVGRKLLSEDVARVGAMRKHLGDGFPLMVDANMQWTVDGSIRAARALQPFELTWIEEPTIPDDVSGNARIVREGGMPIANGENFRSLYEFRTMIAAEALSIPEPDVTNCGGVTSFMKIGHMAEAFNLQVTSHAAHDVSVHLLAALPNSSYLEAHGFGLEKFMDETMVLKDGMAVAPERPGHGVSLRWKELEEHRTA